MDSLIFYLKFKIIKMKKPQLLFCLFAFTFVFFVTPTYAVPNAPKPVEKEAISKEDLKKQAATAKEEWNNLSRKEKKAKRKEMKKELKSALKSAKKNEANSDLDLTLLIILAVLIPPLAMGLYDGITNRFWISLLLTLLFYIPGLIYTLVVILREN